MRIGAPERTPGTSPGGTNTGKRKQDENGGNQGFQKELGKALGETAHHVGGVVEEVVSGEGRPQWLPTAQLATMILSQNIPSIPPLKVVQTYQANWAEGSTTTHTTPPPETPEYPR